MTVVDVTPVEEAKLLYCEQDIQTIEFGYEGSAECHAEWNEIDYEMK